MAARLGSRRLPGAIGLAVLCAMVALRLADPRGLEAQRLAIFDLYQQLHPRPALLDIPVRVVEIDEAALRARGQWPWPRTDLAALVDRLSALGAAVVVLDVILAEYDRTSPTHILKA